MVADDRAREAKRKDFVQLNAENTRTLADAEAYRVGALMKIFEGVDTAGRSRRSRPPGMQPEPADRAGVRRHRREGRADRAAQRVARPPPRAAREAAGSRSASMPAADRPQGRAGHAQDAAGRADRASTTRRRKRKFYIEHLGADFSDYQREHEAYLAQQPARRPDARGLGPLPDHRPGFPPQLPVRARRHRGRARSGRPGRQHDEVSRRPAADRPQSGRRALRRRTAAVRSRTIFHCPAARGRAPTSRPFKAVTMAKAALTDGQTLHAVNDLFIGARTHTSATYEIGITASTRAQSSSGSSSPPASARRRGSRASSSVRSPSPARSAGQSKPPPIQPQAWDATALRFAVREPFPSKTSQTKSGHRPDRCGDRAVSSAPSCRKTASSSATASRPTASSSIRDRGANHRRRPGRPVDRVTEIAFRASARGIVTEMSRNRFSCAAFL